MTNIEEGEKMSNQEEVKSFTFDDLKNAAGQEKWDEVDENIPMFCNDKKSLEWVWEFGIKDKDGNIRDLAVSMAEKSGGELSEENIAELRQVMTADENIYAQYHAAFALFAHGVRTSEVIEKIREALADDDVKEAAEKYLAQIEKA